MATTLVQLYSFESQLETGFNALLNGVTANTYYRRSTEEKATPYLDILVTVGAALMHEKDQTTQTDEDIYTGTLEVMVVTGRATSGQDATHHQMIAATRVALKVSEGDYNATNFPDLAVLEITPGGTSYEIDQDSNLDITAMEFNIVFGIRDTAWPA